MIYSTLCNPAVDIGYTIDTIRPGQTYTDCEYGIEPAGKGLNVAKTVRALGLDVAIAGLIQQDMRTFFQRYCDESGIDPHFLSTPGMTRLNTTIRESAEERSTHLSARGSRVPSYLQERFLEMVRGLVVPGDFWVLTGSVPEGLGPELYRECIRLMQKENAITVLDTRDDALARGVQAKPAVVAPNLAELEGYFREEIRGVHHMALKGKRLVDQGISYVFITLGADGMIALHDTECLLCTVPAVEVINTTGCGDALLAGVVTAMQRRYDFESICRLACACGLSCAMHAGTANIDPGQIEALQKKVDIVSV